MNGSNQQQRIGIAGMWITCNYGALMTTFGLYRTLEKLGYSPVLIDHAPMTKVPHLVDPHNLSRNFVAASGMETTPPIPNKTALAALNDECGAFIVGSDQVWNYVYAARMAPFYFLDFVRDGKTKISYSSSFGHTTDSTPRLVRKLISYWLAKFNGVSCRESSGVDILRERYDTRAEHLLDPVFLCSPEDYDAIVIDPENTGKEPFITAYLLDDSPAKRQALRHVSERLGMNIADVSPHNTEQNAELKAGEWLSRFKNADFIVTDSFHGVCFSIIYSKPFICFANNERGMARFTSLLGSLGLMNRLLSNPEELESAQDLLSPVDYRPVHAQLDALRQHSLDWLSDHLKQPPATAKTPPPYSRLTLKLAYSLYTLKHQIYRILAKLAKGERQRDLWNEKERLFAYRSIILSHLEKHSP